MRLDACIQYDLNDLEIKAYKLCLLWEEIARVELPGYRIDRLAAGDPRKSYLFRYCRKLALQLEGVLPVNMYKYYIYAQISTLKNYSDGKVHCLIEPACLCGEKAWWRWQNWKKKFDAMMLKKELQGKSDITQNQISIIADLKRTKLFLETKLDEITPDNLKKAAKSKDLHKWIAFAQVSPYFVLLCKSLNDKEISSNLDLEIYKNSITADTEKAFKILFEKL